MIPDAPTGRAMQHFIILPAKTRLKQPELPHARLYSDLVLTGYGFSYQAWHPAGCRCHLQGRNLPLSANLNFS